MKSDNEEGKREEEEEKEEERAYEFDDCVDKLSVDKGLNMSADRGKNIN